MATVGVKGFITHYLLIISSACVLWCVGALYAECHLLPVMRRIMSLCVEQPPCCTS